ncbi:hypothetical protein JCM16161A_11280 [Vulcanisaeta sp. JCM 16161]|uniref:hypothetical protein n=1 Tax=Vulcanisaeta sp. JCM 16161 TaxID=1295372 RepID=UPI0006CF7E13|nr:hypothetical protein [Vulcanisaeta sp. JCM 16161]
MLILIHGSLGLDYLIHNVLSSDDWVISMVCPGSNNETGIDIELSPGVIMRIALMWSRILDLRDDDLRLLLDSLTNSTRLYDAVNYVIETYMDYNASRLYYFMKLMSMLNVWRPIGKGCINIPLIEPVKSLVAAVILAHYASNIIKGSAILATDFIDEIRDSLQEVRGLGNIYVFSNRMPRDIGVFDELIITSLSIPQEVFGRLIRVSGGSGSEVLMNRLGLGTVRNNFEFSREALNDVDLEILRIVNELGFTTMASLIDMVTQSAAVARNDVIKELIKLSNMNLVKIRYLSDGRAIVTPTVAGLKLLMAK